MTDICVGRSVGRSKTSLVDPTQLYCEAVDGAIFASLTAFTRVG